MGEIPVSDFWAASGDVGDVRERFLEDFDRVFAGLALLAVVGVDVFFVVDFGVD